MNIRIWKSQNPDSKIYNEMDSDPIQDRIRIYTKKGENQDPHNKFHSWDLNPTDGSGSTTTT